MVDPRAAVVAALLSLPLFAAVGSGPPFDPADRPVHHLTVVVDTAPARDLLAVLGGGAGAPAALKRLRAARPVLRAVEADGTSAEQFLGRAVGVAAGSPDRVLTAVQGAAESLGEVLSSFETEGPAIVAGLGRRVALLLPHEPVRTARVTVVPFAGLPGFHEVTAVREGDDLWLFSDLFLLLADRSTVPRETALKVLRTAASETWRTLFDGGAGRPGWERSPRPFQALVRQTVLEGTATLFLVPDEFFPLDLVLQDPIARSFGRWNVVVRTLADPKVLEREKQAHLADAARGDFWARYPAVTGLGMVDTILRKRGRAAFLKALASGPVPVAALYDAASRGTKLPQLGREAKRELEERAGPVRPDAVSGREEAAPD